MSSAQHGHDGQHHGRGTPDCPTELHHHHDERCVSPLVDRRRVDEQVPIIVSAVEIIDGVEVPIGEPRVRTISRGALDLLHGNVSPLDDRRQRAREAYWDADGGDDPYVSCEAAIETATRVRITPEAVAKFRAAAGGWGGNFADALAEALHELGFEVEE